MGHTEKLELTMNSENDHVVLTPDDILTLKLLRDECRVAYSKWPDQKHRRLEDMKLLETLERILKQVG